MAERKRLVIELTTDWGTNEDLVNAVENIGDDIMSKYHTVVTVNGEEEYHYDFQFASRMETYDDEEDDD